MTSPLSLPSLPVAVTGATGFLGRYLVSSLVDSGCSVVGAVRNPQKIPSLPGPQVEMRQCDLTDRDSLRRAFGSCSMVIANAALFAVGNRHWETHHAANVQGVENTLRAAAEAGISRVLLISSCAVYRQRWGREVEEDHPRLTERDRTPFNAYAVSKSLGETRAWELADLLGLSLTVLRPSVLYGAHDPNVTPRIRSWLGGRAALVPTRIRLALAHAGDVAEAVSNAALRPYTNGHAYNLGGPDLSFSEVMKGLRRAGGKVAPWILPLPLPFRRTVNSRRAEVELGFRNRGYEEGWREVLRREGER